MVIIMEWYHILLIVLGAVIVVGLIVISCCVAFLEIFAPADAAKHVADDIMNGR